MKLALLLFTAIFSALNGSAQSGYAADLIAPELLRHAKVVVRLNETRFEVLNKSEAVETEHKVITLLNDRAERYNELYFHYDRIQQIEDIEGVIYDAGGQVVRRIKKKDIEDMKPLEYFVNDHRLKVLRFPRMAFPYTIEYTVTRKYNGLMFYPVFDPQESPDQSVEAARFELLMPPGLELRFKEKNVAASCKTGLLRWEFHHLPAFEPEPFTPPGDWSLPKIVTAPTAFSLEGYDGDMSTWQSFGNFIRTLNAGKDVLTPETTARLQQLTADCTDPECKIRRVYEYLQNHTRYFFIGLGIGGWQPAPAREVDEVKYGDCKGLSNYMVAMLNAVGIPAQYVLIRATKNEQRAQFPDFPNAWFNHAIACVPLENDTIWLECTSQTESCGFLGDFTDNRPALLITPEGGRLVQTPKYDERVNTIRRETEITLQPDGSARLQTADVYRGIAQDIPSALADMPDERRLKYLYEQLSISDFEITALAFERRKGRLPEVKQKLELAIPKLASASGKRLFVPLAILSGKHKLPTTVDSMRHFPVQAHARGISEEDDVVLHVPESYTLENPVAPVALSSVFGTYELSVQQEHNNLRIHRRLVLNSTVQPPAQYNAWLEFLKGVLKADKTKLVLVH